MKDYNAAVAAEPPLAPSAAVDGCVQFQPGTPPPQPPSLPPAHRRRAFSPSQISTVLPAGVADDDCSR